MNAQWRASRDGRPTQPVITPFGLFGSGNTGNDASLEAMLATLDHLCPEAQVLCICGDPENIVRDIGTPATPIHPDKSKNPVLRKVASLLRSFQESRGYKLVIVPGTGALDDFGTGWTACRSHRSRSASAW